MVVEDLAQKVNRPYLRTPCHKIISAARLVQQKRQEFLASVARGVAPNDSPEPPRRKYEPTHSQCRVQFAFSSSLQNKLRQSINIWMLK